MDTGVNSCKQKPTWSSEQQLGPFYFFWFFFFFLLAKARLHFLCLHAKVFRTAINSALVWVGRPARLAKPFIILGAWNCKAPSQVVGINIGWPRLTVCHQMRRSSCLAALPSVCLSVRGFAFSIQVSGQREMSFHTAHLSYGKHSRANGVMTARPPAFYRRSTTLGFAVECEGRTEESAHTTPASAESTENEKKGHKRLFFF